MIEKLKSIGWSSIGIVFFILVVFIIIFLVRGGVVLIENHQDLINSMNEIIIGIILLLFVLSVIPRVRMITGMSIAYISLVWIFLFWLNCLVITYESWGLVGTAIGAIVMGIGIFATAILASLFSGQWIGALILLVTLIIMNGVRMLGLWIASKQKKSSADIAVDTLE